jgi:LacI family transcriptional regulator
MSSDRTILFIDELLWHSDREVFLGAAEYCVQRLGWRLEPWRVPTEFKMPLSGDLQSAFGILTHERAPAHQVALFRQLKIPVVFYLGSGSAESDLATMDEAAIGEMGAQHLWDRGYREMAFIGSSSARWSKDRSLGFSRWMKAAGKKPRIHAFTSEQLAVFWSYNPATDNQHLRELLARLPKPIGIMAANDVVAYFVLQAVRQNGCHAPEDFGVVGVDDDPFPNAAAGLGISSIELPFRTLGWQAVRLLEERWQGRRARKVLRLPPVRVVVRASTDVFKTGDPLVRKAQAYIESHRSRRLTVKEILRALSCNRVTLWKGFRKELSLTPFDYLRRRRLAYATELLRQGDRSVEEVSSVAGFSSTSYFSKIFNRVVGCRPGSVRRARSGDS